MISLLFFEMLTQMDLRKYFWRLIQQYLLLLSPMIGFLSPLMKSQHLWEVLAWKISNQEEAHWYHTDPKKSSGISHEWKIGIVHSIWYNQRNKSNHIELWEFLDVVDQDWIPSLLKCDRWESMLPLLQIQMYYLDEIELLFLNQVRNKITMCIFIW